MNFFTRQNRELRDIALAARCFKTVISANQLFQDFKAAHKANLSVFKAQEVEDNDIIHIFKGSLMIGEDEEERKKYFFRFFNACLRQEIDNESFENLYHLIKKFEETERQEEDKFQEICEMYPNTLLEYSSDEEDFVTSFRIHQLWNIPVLIIALLEIWFDILILTSEMHYFVFNIRRV